jgi:hypothetical protein
MARRAWAVNSTQPEAETAHLPSPFQMFEYPQSTAFILVVQRYGM